MTYTALIDTASGQVVNALWTPDAGVGLHADVGQSVVEITEHDFNAGPIGRRWVDGVLVGSPAQPTPAAPSAPASLGSIITVEAYRRRFTFLERKAIKALTATDLDVAVIDDDLAAATYVDLDDPATQQGCGILTIKIYNGSPVLTPARVGEIIGNPVQPKEVPNL
jgi:hypothetical protein